MIFCPICHTELVKNNTIFNKICPNNFINSSLKNHSCVIYFNEKRTSITDYYLSINNKSITLENYNTTDECIISITPKFIINMKSVEICESMDIIAKVYKLAIFS